MIQSPLKVSADFIDYPYFSDLGLVQNAAVLRRAGFDVAVLDAFALPESGLWGEVGDSEWLLGCPMDSYFEQFELLADRADVIVFHLSPFHKPPQRDAFLGRLLAHAKALGKGTILADLYQAGQHYIDVSADQLRQEYPEADVWVQYESEVALPAVIEPLVSGSLPSWHRRGHGVEDLDSLPLPAWDLIDLEAKFQFHNRVFRESGRPHWEFPIDGRALPMSTSRGCPYQCSHCSSNPDVPRGERKTQRRFSTSYVKRALEDLKERAGITKAFVLDEMVNVNSKHMNGCLSALEALGVRAEFPNGFRADHLSREQVSRLSKLISTLSISAEHGSQAVLDSVIQKDLKLETIDRVSEWAAEDDLPLIVHFIIGNPEESGRDVNTTLEYALSLYERFGAEPSVQFATPLPGTRLAQSQQALALPIVRDYGPVFQQQPVLHGKDFGPEELKRFKETFDMRLAAARGPNKVIMNVTYRCNNRCTFCAVGNRSQLDGSLERQAEVLFRHRQDGVRLVDFDGGEPTLYPKLVPLVRYAKKIGYTAINITTNGRLCSYPDFAKSLMNSGITSLLFSLHGVDAKTHTQQVGDPDAYEQTIDGIRRCVELNRGHVELGVNITLTKTNTEDLERFTQLVWDLGVRWLNFQFLTPFGRATARINPDTQAIADRVTQIIDKWHDRMKFQVINLPFCFMPNHQEYLMGDLLKIERKMVFVNNEEVNLYDYLKERRSYHEQCHSCPHKIFCGAFYDLEDVPEPPWIIEPADVYAPLEPLDPNRSRRNASPLHILDT